MKTNFTLRATRTKALNNNMNDNTWGPITKYNSLIIATILLIKTKKGGKGGVA